MQGLMMDRPLLISSILDYAASNFATTEIVSLGTGGGEHRYGYAELAARSARLAHALRSLGLETGDRVATLAWNNHRHLELYYGVSGIGGVIHTINPRLQPEQIAWIINHAEDRWLFVDTTFLPLVAALQPHLRSIERVFVLEPADAMPADSGIESLHSYETLIADQPDQMDWPELDEHTAAGLCYTSGTTGHPKGVLYSHRSTVLHAYATAMADTASSGRGDTIMPVVPMFHANAWGLPYLAPIVGARLVFPGPKMADGATLYSLMEDEQVTYTAGVPTIWMALLQWLRDNDRTLTSLRYATVGGAACPPSIIREFAERHGVITAQGWGMTETSPLGSMSLLSAQEEVALGEDGQVERRAMQGRPPFGIELRVTDDDGQLLPRDGESAGRLQVRGAWVCSSYFRDDGQSDAHGTDGWFDTGDVAVIHPDGWLQITDRTKDVIKSGGEWISSIELENLATSHPDVAEAAVIARPHSRWTERPLLVVRPSGKRQPTMNDLRAQFTGRVPDWWIPEDAVYIDEMPLTATGKISKLTLRERFADYRFPSDGA